MADTEILTTFVTSVSDTSVVAELSAGTLEVYALSATWAYEDQGINGGTTWREVAFDDSSWATGPARLGFGADGEVTTINNATPAVTYYFRKDIAIVGGAEYDEYDLEFIYDDGLICWVNNQEVARVDVPTGAIWTTLATATIGDGAVHTATIPASAFVEGNNVIAVEVHNINTTSSDISFDMGLSARKYDYYSATGPASVDEGTSDTFTLSGVGIADDTFYYSIHPTEPFVETDGSFSFTSESGSITISAAPEGIQEGDTLVAIDFRTDSIAGTIVNTISTTVIDIDVPTFLSGWSDFREGVSSYTSTTDTYVDSANGTTAYDTQTFIQTDNVTGEQWGLLRFGDLSAAFTDNTLVNVSSASLDLEVVREGRGADIFNALIQWDETDTYNSNTNITVANTGYLSVSTVGVYGNSNNYTGPINVVLDAQQVQDWIRDPSNNFGMVIQSTAGNDGQDVASSENATSTFRPKLNIAYVEPE